MVKCQQLLKITAQQNYCSTKRELYSAVYFLQHFKQYLLGGKFLLCTNLAPLVWLCNFREPSGILARWLNILGTYDYVTEYRPGRLHANADALSRKPSRPCPLPQCEECRLHFRKEAETIVSTVPGEAGFDLTSTLTSSDSTACAGWH